MKTKSVKTLKASYNYRIVIEKKLIIESFSGDISVEFLKESMLQEFKDPDHHILRYGLCDLRNVNFILTDQDIKKLFNFSLQNDPNLKIKWATLTDAPYETTMAMIYENQAVKHYGYKTFTTIDAASNYLKIALTEEDLKF